MADARTACRLERVLALGATVFAGLSKRHEELVQGVSTLDAGSSWRSAATAEIQMVMGPGSGAGEGPADEREALAAAMVALALDAVVGEEGPVAMETA